jgi:hypothetical protein
VRLGPGSTSIGRLLPGVLLLVLLCACGELDESELSTQVESLQSLTQEGILLARGVVDGSAHAPFVQVHAEEMANSASDVADSLSSQQAPSELAVRKAKAVGFAKEIANQLKKLSDHPDDAGEARSVRGALEKDVNEMHEAFGGSQ